MLKYNYFSLPLFRTQILYNTQAFGKLALHIQRLSSVSTVSHVFRKRVSQYRKRILKIKFVLGQAI